MILEHFAGTGGDNDAIVPQDKLGQATWNGLSKGLATGCARRKHTMEGRYHHRSRHPGQLFSEAEQEASRGGSAAAVCLWESHRDDLASPRTCFQFAERK